MSISEQHSTNLVRSADDECAAWSLLRVLPGPLAALIAAIENPGFRAGPGSNSGQRQTEKSPWTHHHDSRARVLNPLRPWPRLEIAGLSSIPMPSQCCLLVSSRHLEAGSTIDSQSG